MMFCRSLSVSKPNTLLLLRDTTVRAIKHLTMTFGHQHGGDSEPRSRLRLCHKLQQQAMASIVEILEGGVLSIYQVTLLDVVADMLRAIIDELINAKQINQVRVYRSRLQYIIFNENQLFHFIGKNIYI